MMDAFGVLRDHSEAIILGYGGEMPTDEAERARYLAAVSVLAEVERHEVWQRFALRQTEATEQIADALTVLAKAMQNTAHPLMVLDSKAWGDKPE